MALDVGWPLPPPEEFVPGDNGMMTTGLEDDNALDPQDPGR
jgi:hypothetical protein